MFKQFSNCPEIKYKPMPATEGKEGPQDLDNFRLERIKKEGINCKDGNENGWKLVLFGNNKVNIFMIGPDDLINILFKRLSSDYIGKSWSEISKINMKRHSHCDNHVNKNYCNPLVMKYTLFSEENPLPGQNISYLAEVDEICARCSNFKSGF